MLVEALAGCRLGEAQVQIQSEHLEGLIKQATQGAPSVQAAGQGHLFQTVEEAHQEVHRLMDHPNALEEEEASVIATRMSAATGAGVVHPIDLP